MKTSHRRSHLRRKIVNAVMLSITAVCAAVAASILLFILGYMFWRGGRSLDWDFFTELPRPSGVAGGGMANAIVGSIKLLALATLIGFPIGFLAGVYLSEYGRGFLPAVVRYVTDLLNGVPSILIGVFAYTLIVLPMRHFSTFAGAMALAVMMIPVAVRSTEEFLRGVPKEWREGAAALGAPKWRTITSIVIPAAARGIVTAIMLDLARVAGETAPLLFTSLNNSFWSHGWNDATASLPVTIYTYSISPYEDWHRQAWAAGFVLLASIFFINILARFVVSRGFVHSSR